MIRVTMELIPHGNPTNVQHLGTVHIANDGTGSQSFGNYNVTALGKTKKVFAHAKVIKHPRKGEIPLRLLYKSLKAIFENEPLIAQVPVEERDLPDADS